MGAFVISVANRKGGTGKTTTAVHLAAGLAQIGRTVLLIDFDTLGHSGHALGVAPERGAGNAHEASGDADALVRAIRPTRIKGLDLVPANRSRGTDARAAEPLSLARSLSAPGIASRYDVIVIDTAPSYDGDMVMALAASDAVLVPFVPHPLALDGIRQFSKIFLMIRMRLNPGLRHFGLTACQFNPQSAVHRSITAAVSREFGADKLLGSIRSDIRLAECAGTGKTAYEFASGCRGAADYRSLVSMVAARWMPPAAMPAASAENPAGSGQTARPFALLLRAS